MKIVICSLATLTLAVLAGAANADQPATHGTAVQEHSAYQVPAGWVRDYSGPPMTATGAAPVTAAPEINSTSAISALVLLGGALILMRGRSGSTPTV